jgi:hypothetical protein
MDDDDRWTVRIPEAIRISGLSRSEIYRLAGRGKITLLKCGRSTLVVVPTLRRVIDELPHAQISTGKPD